MKNIMLLTAVSAFALVSGAAGAATLTNHDKTDAKVTVEVGGKKETVTLKEHGVFDSKDKDAIFTIGTEKPVSAKASEHFAVKGGKVEAVKTDVVAPTDTTASTTTTTTTTETKPVETKPADKVVKTDEGKK